MKGNARCLRVDKKFQVILTVYRKPLGPCAPEPRFADSGYDTMSKTLQCSQEAIIK